MRFLEALLSAAAVALIAGSVLSFSIGFDPRFNCDQTGFMPLGAGADAIACGTDCSPSDPCVPFARHDGYLGCKCNLPLPLCCNMMLDPNGNLTNVGTCPVGTCPTGKCKINSVLVEDPEHGLGLEVHAACQ